MTVVRPKYGQANFPQPTLCDHTEMEQHVVLCDRFRKKFSFSAQREDRLR